MTLRDGLLIIRLKLLQWRWRWKEFSAANPCKYRQGGPLTQKVFGVYCIQLHFFWWDSSSLLTWSSCVNNTEYISWFWYVKIVINLRKISLYLRNFKFFVLLFHSEQYPLRTVITIFSPYILVSFSKRYKKFFSHKTHI